MEGENNRMVCRSGFCPLSTRGQTQIVRRGGQYLYLQSHITDPNLSFYTGNTVDKLHGAEDSYEHGPTQNYELT